MRVSNLTSPRTDNPVANQYEIVDGNTATFQSYQTVIAKNVSGHFVISTDYNYSRTTSKYFNRWLRSYGIDGDELKEVRKWLDKARVGDKDLSRSRFTLELVSEL